MKKVLLILFVLMTSLWGNIEELLYIESKLYPKIIMLDKSVNKKEKIVFDILYDEENYHIAKVMSQLLRKNGVDTRLDKIPRYCKNADAYILVTKNVSERFINNLLRSKKLIFSVYPDMIKNSMISVYIGIKVKPIINPSLIKKGYIKLNPILLKVAKIYEED